VDVEAVADGEQRAGVAVEAVADGEQRAGVAVKAVADGGERVLSEPAAGDALARPGELVLASERWRLGVLPDLGGCWSFGRIRVGERWVDLLRPTPAGALGNPEQTASFPLIPWSNRIRHGVLDWAGERHQLVRNGADGTAIHGAVRQLPWRVVGHEPHRLELALSSYDAVGVNWPWRFAARQVLSLVGDALEVQLSVTNEDSVAFPAGLGHHPYFQRALFDDDAVLQVDAHAGYELDAGIALGAAGQLPARADFREPRTLGPDFVDDVLTDLGPTAARWHYPDAGVEVSLVADDVYSHLVVYLPVGKDHFAVEPVSHTNDGIALHGRGVPATGVRVLEPGETLTGTFTLAAAEQPAGR